MFDVDAVALHSREVLRDRTPALVAESCAWSVGLSDQAHHVRRHGRVVPTGLTLGMRAAAAQSLTAEEDVRLDLGDAPPGSFADALGALTADGGLQADRFEAEVLAPFVLDTCVETARRVRAASPAVWQELLDELGEDGTDLDAVVRAAEWDVPLRTAADELVLAALGAAPLVEVEAEGLPLSLVRAAEAEARRAAEAERALPGPTEDELAGALFLAEVALGACGLPQPVAPADADAVLAALLAEGLEPAEVLRVLPRLPLPPDTAQAVAAEAARDAAGGS